MKFYWYWSTCTASLVWLPLFGSFSFLNWTVFLCAEFLDNLRQPSQFVCLVYSLVEIYYFSLIQRIKNSWEKNKVGTNLTQLNMIFSQKNWLVIFVFLINKFHLSFAALYYYFVLRCADFLPLNCLLLVRFAIIFRCFLAICYNKRMEILFSSVSFCPPMLITNSF